MKNKRTAKQRKAVIGSETFSVFGQIEQVAADMMIEKYALYRIPTAEIPESVRFNDVGALAKFAVVVPRSKVREFNETIARLRA